LNHSYSLSNLSDVSAKADIHPDIVVFIEVSAKPSFWQREVKWVAQVANVQRKKKAVDPKAIQVGAIIGHAGLEQENLTT